MRYLSDDGKVFNTYDECREYEENIKKKNADEEKRKQKLNQIRKEYERITDDINTWLDAYDAYSKAYPDLSSTCSLKESYFDLNRFVDFLQYI